MWRAEQNFWRVAAHLKRRHYKNITLVVVIDAALVKQKPVENSTIAQSFQKGEKASEEKKPERRCSQNKHGLFNSKGGIALQQV